MANPSVTAIKAKGRNITVADNDILNAYTGIELNDPSVESTQINYKVTGNRVIGDVYGLIAFGSITGMVISNNSFSYGAQKRDKKGGRYSH